jgi:hypothetical protein
MKTFTEPVFELYRQINGPLKSSFSPGEGAVGDGLGIALGGSFFACGVWLIFIITPKIRITIGI